MSNHIQTTQMLTPSIRVLVADDHPVVRRGIVSELAACPDIAVMGEAVNSHDAIRQIQSLTLDVLILDISMPGPCTADVLQLLATLPTPPRVLILTAHNEPEYILAMLRAGAKGYALKDEYPEHIVMAVRAVARGETWLSAAALAGVIDYNVNEPEEPDTPILSTRETEVLEQLVLGKDNQEIGDQLCISERTVRFHLRNIYDKLGVRRRGEAIAWGIHAHLERRSRIPIRERGVFSARRNVNESITL